LNKTIKILSVLERNERAAVQGLSAKASIRVMKYEGFICAAFKP
jgi:hypothetical protein